MTQRIQTPITGITTTSVYEEGSCYSLVNLRPKNGALQPVAPRKIVQELTQKYDIVFVHQNNDYMNWIGVVNDGDYSSVYWKIRDETPKLIEYDKPGEINSVQQIGNTLSLITEDSIYYLFYHNNNYTFLGQMPQVPVINLGAHSQAHAKHYFANEYGSDAITPGNFIDATKGLVNKAIDILINGTTNSNGEQVGGFGLQLFDAHFIRYAFRLYDGTLTKHSPPILVMPTRDIVGKEEEGNLESIKTISYCFDGTLKNDSCVDVYGHKIALSYDFREIEGERYSKWADIIKSVDIFMSPPLGVSNIENIRTDMFTNNTSRYLHYNMIKGLSAEALKSVANASTFYLVRSIPLGSSSNFLKPEEFPTTEADITKMENLIYQEVMTDDNFSNHRYGAQRSYTYNNRLHLGNIKTTFFKGFSPKYFQWMDTYNSIVPPEGNVNYIVAEVDIYAGTSLEKVYSSAINYNSYPPLFASVFISYPDPRAKRITIYEVNESVWTKVYAAELEPHNLLNLAYHLNDKLLPIVGKVEPEQVSRQDTSKVITLSEPNKIKVSELNNPLYFPNTNTYQTGNGTILAMATNAMNVSDRNYGQYPLYVFTTQGVWTLNVGSGEVVYSTQTAPTYTEAPTTGIVGETPYGVVFTTQRGLLIINGQSVNFISPQIEQTPKLLNIEMNSHCDGVVLLSEVNKFSELLKDVTNLIYNPYENELIINIKTAELNYVFNFSNQIFYQTTEKIDNLVGNVYPELFIINNKTLKDYAFSESPLTHVSFIMRPLMFGSPDIKKFERMILRCLLYGVTKPADNKFSLFMVHYSMDGVNFKALTGYPIKEGNNKDLDSRLMSRSKFSYCLYTLSGVLSQETEIFYLDAELDKEYSNTKMR